MKKNVSKENAIIAYKGFNIDFSCRDFLYKVGKEYHIDGDIEVCKNGFHACQNALDVFAYYKMSLYRRYAMVELWGDVDFATDGKKLCASNIRIVKEMSIGELVEIGIMSSSQIIEVKKDDESRIKSRIISSKTADSIYNPNELGKVASCGSNTSILSIGHLQNIASSGDGADIDVTGDYTEVSANGRQPIIKSVGAFQNIFTSGHGSRVISHGDDVNVASGGMAEIYSDGEYAGLYASGAESKIASIGNKANICINSIRGYVNSCGSDARIMSAENLSTIESTGENALVMSAGHNTKARAKVGSWIVLTEYENNGKIKFVKSEYVDGERIKGDTLYKLVDGEFVETI